MASPLEIEKVSESQRRGREKLGTEIIGTHGTDPMSEMASADSGRGGGRGNRGSSGRSEGEGESSRGRGGGKRNDKVHRDRGGEKLGGKKTGTVALTKIMGENATQLGGERKGTQPVRVIGQQVGEDAAEVVNEERGGDAEEAEGETVDATGREGTHHRHPGLVGSVAAVEHDEDAIGTEGKAMETARRAISAQDGLDPVVEDLVGGEDHITAGHTEGIAARRAVAADVEDKALSRSVG